VSNVPRVPVPEVAVVNVRFRSFPFASRTSIETVASNTFAVPRRRIGLRTASPGSGDSTRICGVCSSIARLPTGGSTTTPSPPTASTGSPSIRNATRSIVGKRVSVATTWATRPSIDALPPPSSNVVSRSTVATLSASEMSRRVVPSGIALESPSAPSSAVGPSSSSVSAARATAGVASIVRRTGLTFPSRRR
jgi:hypothetical protein